MPLNTGNSLARDSVSSSPFAEQHRIVVNVDGLMALVDHRLETQLAVSPSAAEILMEAVIAELTAA